MTDRSIQAAYLVATARSGTNLLRSILEGHPRIAAPPPFEEAFPRELPELRPDERRKFIRDVLLCQKYSSHGLHADISPEDVQERQHEWSFYELQRGFYESYADSRGAHLWVTKYNGTPFSRVEGAVDHFDDLKLLYLVRDVRDVALSFKSTTVGPYHPYLSAGLWTLEQSVGKRLLEREDPDVLLVKYEKLLEDPNREIRRICSFLDVESVDEMLAYHERSDTEQMASRAHMFENLSRPIMSDNYGKFHDELPAKELKIVEKVAREPLQYFGYELVHSEERLDDLDLQDRAAYEEIDDRMETEFVRRRWRENPREMLDVRLWQRFIFFLYLRYGLFHR